LRIPHTRMRRRLKQSLSAIQVLNFAQQSTLGSGHPCQQQAYFMERFFGQ
jgi:hypothetical protein